MSKTRLIVAMAAIASLGSVAAADGYEPAGKAMLAPVADYAWGGFYVGVGIGAAQFDNSVKSKGEAEKYHQHCYKYAYCGPYSKNWTTQYYRDTYGSGSSGDDAWNVFGTMQVGYDHMVGKKFLVGVFADFDFFPNSESSIATKMGGYDWYGKECKKDCHVGHMNGSLDLDHIWNIGGRLGFLVSPRWLIYGGGGYSQASIDGSLGVRFHDAPTVKMDLQDELQGWFLEAGAEVKMHRNVSLKFGYRYQEFDDSHVSGSAYSVKYGCCHSGNRYKWRDLKKAWAEADIETEIHTVRATLVLSLTPEQRPVVPLK